MSSSLETDHRNLQAAFASAFKVNLKPYDFVRMPKHRPDVACYFFATLWNSLVPSDPGFSLEVRKWLESNGWQCARQPQKSKLPDMENVDLIYIGKLTPLPIRIGYHSTHGSCFESIQKDGLLPSSPERQRSQNRQDPERNIYICENLGCIEDARAGGVESAHGWRYLLCEDSNKSDVRILLHDWIILKINLDGMQEARVYQDIFSASGLIVDSVSSIPPDRLQVVYPMDDKAN